MAAFKARWDLRRFDGERLKKYFLEVTTKAIDVEKFIRNLLWQTYSWIKWGIRGPTRGTCGPIGTRSRWRSVTRHHGRVLLPGARGGGRVHVFMITDFDWAGSSISSNFEKLLRKELETGQVVLHPAVRLGDFADEGLEWGRSVAAHYVLEGGKPVPLPGTCRRVVNSALKWFEGVLDPRHKSVEETAGKQVHTIWKVSVDTLDWDPIRQGFEGLLAAARDGP